MRKYINPQITRCQKAMAMAKSYQSWRDAALELDYLEANTEWKESYRSNLYNYELIYDRLLELKRAKEGRYLKLVHYLREGLHHDLGNMVNPALYQQCYVGTKHLIEEYINQVCDALIYVAETDNPGFDLREKFDFFRDLLLSYGRPSLLLSGGASLGLFHLGVVKALWERDLLPTVISGSSAGAVMAAMMGRYADQEFHELFDPQLHDMKVWRWQGLFNGFRGKGFMDISLLESCLKSNIGDYSFLEAYQRTGRSINISVSPVKEHQNSRLLSGYTTPHILLWSGALASSAVPGVFPPVQLVKHDENGNNVPYMPKLRWVDGSVVSDLPIDRLTHLYNVNFMIVSQTNPHIVPFIRTAHHKSFLKSLDLPWKAIKAEMKFHGAAALNYLRKSSDRELFRQTFGQAYAILAQRYSGDVTIAPHYTLWHYAKMMQNPDKDMAARLILEGERATWPKMALISTHAKISHVLEKMVDKLKGQLRAKININKTI